MKYTSKEVGKNKFEYLVTVSADTLKECHQEAVKSLGKRAKVSGFRKGHVPMEILERSLDPRTVANVELNDALSLTMAELLSKEDVQPLTQPSIELTKYVPGQELEFKATVEIIPPVKLADATKLGVKKPVVKVEDKQIDEVVKRLQTSDAKKKPVERAAQKGDEVIVDFTGIKDGVEFPGGKAKDYPLELGSGAFIPGFEEGIEGHKAGEQFDIEVTFPKEYGAKELAGMKATFKINLKKVNELTLPQLDDKFAASVAPDFKTMDDLRADIRKQLEADEESTKRSEYYGQLLDTLADKSNPEIPDQLIEAQMPELRKQFEQNLMYRGLNLADYLKQAGKTEDDWVENELRPTAEKKVRNQMVLNAFAEKYREQTTVSDVELAEYQAKILSRYNNPRVKANFETPEAMQNMRNQLATEKTMQLLADLNEGNVKPSK